MPTARLEAEIAFHDRQAASRAGRFRDSQAFCFEDAAYLDHETWIRPSMQRLGEVANCRVLDLGCGHGMASVVLARRGARVTALDLSGGYLREACQRARANGVNVQFVQGDGERLPFADGSFDRIWGNAVLHHLDMTRAAREIHRVLCPGGWAVFSEPWGNNALLAAARRWLPYPEKERTRDEEPLLPRHLQMLRQIFPDLHFEGHQFLAMVRRLLGPGRLSRVCQAADEWLLPRVPKLQQFCRYAVLTLKRNG